jgi:hypothetical protein
MADTRRGGPHFPLAAPFTMSAPPAVTARGNLSQLSSAPLELARHKSGNLARTHEGPRRVRRGTCQPATAGGTLTSLGNELTMLLSDRAVLERLFKVVSWMDWRRERSPKAPHRNSEGLNEGPRPEERELDGEAKSVPVLAAPSVTTRGACPSGNNVSRTDTPRPRAPETARSSARRLPSSFG